MLVRETGLMDRVAAIIIAVEKSSHLFPLVLIQTVTGILHAQGFEDLLFQKFADRHAGGLFYQRCDKFMAESIQPVGP